MHDPLEAVRTRVGRRLTPQMHCHYSLSSDPVQPVLEVTSKSLFSARCFRVGDAAQPIRFTL